MNKLGQPFSRHDSLRRPMETLDDTLKIRLPSALKSRLKETAEADPDVDDLSKWVRQQLRVGERIARQKRET